MKRNLSIFLLVLIILLAIISHFTFLSERILHHDEGVNYFFTQGIFENKVFIYNPLNYHGPFYFYLILRFEKKRKSILPLFFFYFLPVSHTTQDIQFMKLFLYFSQF